MRFLTRKTDMVDAERALAGREQAIPTATTHTVLGTPLKPPFPEGYETAVFGLGCFWGAERVFWQADGVYSTAVGYAGGFTPNPTYEEVCSAQTGHTEAVLVVFDPARTTYEQLLKLFWENHDPTQGMRQGNDVGTQYRSAIYTTNETAGGAGARLARRLPGEAEGVRLRRDHDRDRARRRVLLRRGLPPAVPREEPQRLLRPRRHGRLLPDRPRRRIRPTRGQITDIVRLRTVCSAGKLSSRR